MIDASLQQPRTINNERKTTNRTHRLGKMGKEIEQIALSRGHEIMYKIDEENKQLLEATELSKADVAIEFTQPESAVGNMRSCFAANVPVVVGTTGWLSQLETIKNECAKGNHALFYSSNFSVGVNLFFELNKKLASLMQGHEEYAASMSEIHHIHKKDHPSGTGITLADGIISGNSIYTTTKAFLEGEEVSLEANELPIECIRKEEVPGTHTVIWQSKIDRIQITHEAFSRKGFATGAVLAAEWLYGKTGVYGMKDLLGI